MDDALLAIGIGIVVVGVIVSIIATGAILEYQSFFGTLSRSLHQTAQKEYEVAQSLFTAGMGITILGGIMTTYGVVRNRIKGTVLVCNSCGSLVYTLRGSESRDALDAIIADQYRKEHPDKDPTAPTSTGRVV